MTKNRYYEVVLIIENEIKDSRVIITDVNAWAMPKDTERHTFNTDLYTYHYKHFREALSVAKDFCETLGCELSYQPNKEEEKEDLLAA